MSTTRPATRTSWITNYAPPYRRLVWEELARRTELDIRLFETANPKRLKRDNRGQDWAPPRATKYSLTQIPTFRFAKGETVLHVAKSRAFSRRRRPTAAVIGGWESPAHWQALLDCKINGVRTVGFYESTLQSNRFHNGPIAAARSAFLRTLDAVVVPGLAAREAVLQHGVNPDRIYEGFNAVDVQGIHRKVNEERESLSAPRGHNFLYIGQLIDRKNVGSLIDAFASMANSLDTLTIVGAGENLASLETQARMLGIANQVSFVGLLAYAELPGIFARHNTLVLPSSGEVWGLVVNEALAGGLHAVVSNRCGVAPSVAAMRGVYVGEPNSVALSLLLRASREEWAGPIKEPAILQHTPKAFADVFARALEI